MHTILDIPGLVTLEGDRIKRLYVTHWKKYFGPHFKKVLEALLAEVKTTGVQHYISNASAARDVPSPEDFQWVETQVKPALLKAGLKKFITVVPASSLGKMTTMRFGKLASEAGVETYQVESLQQGLDAAAGKLAA
jgi:hypothetical protein